MRTGTDATPHLVRILWRRCRLDAQLQLRLELPEQEVPDRKRPRPTTWDYIAQAGVLDPRSYKHRSTPMDGTVHTFSLRLLPFVAIISNKLKSCRNTAEVAISRPFRKELKVFHLTRW